MRNFAIGAVAAMLIFLAANLAAARQDYSEPNPAI